MNSKKKSYEVWHPDSVVVPGTKHDPQATNGHTGTTNGYMGNHEGDPEIPDGASEGDEVDRGSWGNKAEFLLSCIGMSVGLGNVWRFPYLAYEHGGAAFVIAYLVLQLLIGKPMYFMELCMGQYSGKGVTKVWEMNPAAKGVGIGMCIACLIVAIYYNVIMAYTLYFFFSSMQATLPWTECTQDWLDNYNCTSKRAAQLPQCADNATFNECLCTGNTTIDSLFNCTQPVTNVRTAAELFFYREVIHKSPGLEPENMGIPLWKLTLCLLLSWIIVVICLIKGIKSSGKVVYFTATFPYVILLILLIRGCLLDGAIDGVRYFIVPKWEKLSDLKVWVAAAGQMFFSLGIAFGAILVFGSYNKFKNQVYYDSLVISAMDLITSLISGFVIFSTLGGLAKAVGVDVSKVAKASYGLAFVVYPEALSNLPPPQLWSVLFFFMLFTLGLDSEFAMLETVLTGFHDEFPFTRKYKSQICVITGVICFFLALPCMCPGGDYVVTIMDHYGADFSLLFLACFEVISVMWVYGVMRFLRDIEYMLGGKPHGWPYWVFCWTLTSPIIIALLILYRMVTYESPTYDNGEPFPEFAQAIGWVLLTIVLSPVPIWFTLRLVRAVLNPSVPTFKEKLLFMFAPTPLWGPNDGIKRIQKQHVPDQTMGLDPVSQWNGHSYDNPVTVTDKF